MYNLRPEIRDKLPTFAREKPTPLVIKDHHFYASGKEISWNNKSRISKKQYQFYQLYNDKAQLKLQTQAQQEMQDQTLINEIRNVKNSFERHKALERLQNRSSERVFLQQKSDQANFQENLKLKHVFELQSTYDKKMMSKAIQAKHAVNTDNKWNFVLEADKKHADFLLTDFSIRGEERFVEHINSRIEEQKSLEDLRKKAYQEKHHEIRSSFLRLTERNLELEERSKLNTKRTNSFSFKNELTNKTVASLDLRLDTSATDKTIAIRAASTIKPAESSELRLNTSGTDNLNPYFASSLRSKESQAPFVHEYGLPSFIQRPGKALNFGGDSSLGQKTQQLGRTIQRLAEPKKSEIDLKNRFERSEYKDTWVKLCDDRIHDQINPFVQSLTSKSELYSRVLDVSKSSRRGNSPPSTIARPLTSLSKPSVGDTSKNHLILSRAFEPTDRSASSTKPSTSLARSRTKFKSYEDGDNDDNKGLNDPKSCMNDLDKFDRISLSYKKRTGYPRIAFEEAKKLSSQEVIAQIAASKGTLDRANTLAF